DRDVQEIRLRGRRHAPRIRAAGGSIRRCARDGTAASASTAAARAIVREHLSDARGVAITAFRFCPVCATPLERRMAGEREREPCPACDWGHWNNPAPVVAAVIEYHDRVLLARNAAWPPKMFALVTGFLERDETPQAAVAREVKEETNLDTRATNLIGVYE